MPAHGGDRRDAWGPIDVWINNAGADVLTGEQADWPFLRKLQELLDVDVAATMLLARDVGRRHETCAGQKKGLSLYPQRDSPLFLAKAA